MIFYSFFKTLVGKEVTVELKNDLSITGVLHSVDQYLNIKLTEISVGEPERHPQASFFLFSLFPFSYLALFYFREEGLHHRSQRRTNTIKTQQQTKLQLATVKNVFIRGSVVRYVKVKAKEFFWFFSSTSTSFASSVLTRLSPLSPSTLKTHQLPTDGVDTELLHDATRREARGQ